MNPFKRTKGFLAETTGELKKTTWPTAAEFRRATVVVVAGTIVISGFVAIVDFSLFQVVNLFIDFVR